MLLGQLNLKPSALPLDDVVRHVGTEDLVPGDEERLRVVVLVPLELVVHIMVRAVVVEQELKRVPGQPQRAVDVDGLDRGEGEEVDARPGSHPREEEGHGPSDGVEEETLDGVVVQGPVGVGGDQGVVDRVDVLVQELVDVHVPVPKVLP